MCLLLELQINIERPLNLFQNPGQLYLICSEQDLHFAHIFEYIIHLFLLERVDHWTTSRFEWIIVAPCSALSN